MPYDVVVIGGGVGGLTVAALLSARGLSTCVLERQSQVGGCIGRIKHSGFEFEPGMGLYSSWGQGEVFDRIFSELPVTPPSASLIDSEYRVRLAHDTDITLFKSDTEFFEELGRAFPDCKNQVIEFYKTVAEISEASTRPLDKPRRGIIGRLLGSSSNSVDSNLRQAQSTIALSYGTNTSPRFQRFIDAQLRAFLHTSIDRCSFASACTALSIPRHNLYALNNGVAAVAERLAESIKTSGGTVRLNAPVLRLAYSESGEVIGVDLLSGERVLARKAIVSNLTVWDTYGRLVGLQRTPPGVKSELQKKLSSGAYLIYASVDTTTLERLPAHNFLVAGSEDVDDSTEFTVSIASTTSDDDKRPATIKTRTDVVPWFSFQTSEEDYEQRDQEALEQFWRKLHKAVPELGSGIEVIETANPRTYYDETRRKLGMVMGVELTPGALAHGTGFSTPIPKLFLVGDTAAAGPQIASVASIALQLTNHLTK